MRLAYYAGASTAAAAACLVKAFHERPNFYSATVYLSQSSACLLILTNLLLVCAVTFIYGLQRLLYGPLRPIEIEQLSEKAWYAVLDTLLAMPSFREDVGGWLLTMFVLLLAGKVWGWIAEGRVDILEQQPPANPRLFHARLATSLILSVVFDVYMTYYCFDIVAGDPRPGMMVIFTFEFAILTIFSIFTLLRYQLSVIATEVTKQQTVKAIEERKKEIQAERAAARQNNAANGSPAPASSPIDEPIEIDENEVDVPGWEEKRRYLFALEVFTDFTKLVLYLIFFTVSITFNGLPMHIMRDVYMTFASFSKRLSDYMNYKKATSDMNARYPDATTTEIRDDSCIVCRETMVAWEEAGADAGPEAARPRRDEGLRAKKLPCGHILHLRCLKAWLERQQVCPTCRRPVLTAPPARTQPAAVVQGDAAPAPGAPGIHPAPARNNAVAPRRPNRARFFNLGPIRIGFLNGPAGQINDMINQLQGGQPQVGPGRDAQAVHRIQAENAPRSGSIPTPEGIGRMTQHDMVAMHNRIAREISQLSLDQSQLMHINAMSLELQRLQAIQAARNPAPTVQAQTYLVDALTVTPQATTVLHGNVSQQLGAGHTPLPEGVTLPIGWTLVPLQAESQPSTSHVPISLQHAPHLANATPHVHVPLASVSHQRPPMAVAPRTASANAHAADRGPTDESGSPLFAPVATSVQTDVEGSSHADALDRGVASSATSDSATDDVRTETTEPVQDTTKLWASSEWNFSDADANGTATENGEASHETEPTKEDKGKGRAVEVLEVPDSQN